MDVESLVYQMGSERHFLLDRPKEDAEEVKKVIRIR
jgi:hypothetical protein